MFQNEILAGFPERGFYLERQDLVKGWGTEDHSQLELNGAWYGEIWKIVSVTNLKWQALNTERLVLAELPDGCGNGLHVQPRS